MLKQRRMVAEQIAGALFEAEAAIDAALAKTAQLAGVMPALRKEAGLSAIIGQDAVEHAAQALTALAEARRAIVETHKELSIAKSQAGLGANWYRCCRRSAGTALNSHIPSSASSSWPGGTSATEPRRNNLAHSWVEKCMA